MTAGDNEKTAEKVNDMKDPNQDYSESKYDERKKHPTNPINNFILPGNTPGLDCRFQEDPN